ncbi:MAG: fused MFS/spermidine synthase [Spirochaetia bacterium]|nr:fused MFS/spermidine synthase [Spirochaetia bacterium]
MNKFERAYIFFTVFVTGAAVLVLEILGTRIIAPYYGTTVYVWSALIGVTMLALAAGYFAGGMMADKFPEQKIMYYLVLSSAALFLLMQAGTAPVLKFTDPLGSRTGALAASFILFFPPLMILGMVSPYAVRLASDDIKGLGVTAGTLYAVSTAGSFVGAITAGYFLIPNIGIRLIIQLCALVLALTAGVKLFMSGKKAVSVVLLAVVAVLLLLSSNEQTYGRRFNVVYAKQSAYTNFKIADEAGTRYLVADGACQTGYDMDRGEFIFGYIDMMEQAALSKKGAKDFLVIGLGGGALPHRLNKTGIIPDVVEIDPAIADAARKYFKYRGPVVIDDGRHYVRTCGKKYDVILVDAFSGHSIYQYIFSLEAFTELRSALKEGGLLAVNSVGRMNRDAKGNTVFDEFLSAQAKTLRAAFPQVKVFAAGFGLTNLVLMASQESPATLAGYIDAQVPDGDVMITDDYNPVESMTSSMIEQWRRDATQFFGQDLRI